MNHAFVQTSDRSSTQQCLMGGVTSTGSDRISSMLLLTYPDTIRSSLACLFALHMPCSHLAASMRVSSPSSLSHSSSKHEMTSSSTVAPFRSLTVVSERVGALLGAGPPAGFFPPLPGDWMLFLLALAAPLAASSSCCRASIRAFLISFASFAFSSAFLPSSSSPLVSSANALTPAFSRCTLTLSRAMASDSSTPRARLRTARGACPRTTMDEMAQQVLRCAIISRKSPSCPTKAPASLRPTSATLSS
mmetsp:Transcript_24062/g.60915  ORF Transcript_24062/g.60915 Transcript_24062/m.60915 type:complete len:248 (-) Transcript_24062:208-951(-)